jgi:hypothetical protein
VKTGRTQRRKESLRAWASRKEACTDSTDGQILPKLPGNQRPIGSVKRSDALENVLVFNHGHFAAAGVEKSSTTAKVGV